MNDLPQTIYSPSVRKPSVPDEFLLQFLSPSFREEIRTSIPKDQLDVVEQKKCELHAEIVTFIEKKIEEFEGFSKQTMLQYRLEQEKKLQASQSNDIDENTASPDLTSGVSSPVHLRDNQERADPVSADPSGTTPSNNSSQERSGSPLRSNLTKKHSSRSSLNSDSEQSIADTDLTAEKHERQVSFSIHPDTVYFSSEDQPTALYSSDEISDDDIERRPQIHDINRAAVQSTAQSADTAEITAIVDNKNNENEDTDTDTDTDADSSSYDLSMPLDPSIQAREVNMNVDVDASLDDWPTMPSVSDFQPDPSSNSFDSFAEDFIEDISCGSSSVESTESDTAADGTAAEPTINGHGGAAHDSSRNGGSDTGQPDPEQDYDLASNLQFPLISHTDEPTPMLRQKDGKQNTTNQKTDTFETSSDANDPNDSTDDVEDIDDDVFEFDEAMESSPRLDVVKSPSPQLPPDIDQGLASMLRESVVDPALSSSLPSSSILSSSFKPRSTIKYLDAKPKHKPKPKPKSSKKSVAEPEDNPSSSSSSASSDDEHYSSRFGEGPNPVSRKKSQSSQDLAGSLPIQIVMPVGSARKASLPESMLESGSSYSNNNSDSAEVSARYGDVYADEEAAYFSPSTDMNNMTLAQRLELQKQKKKKTT